MAVVDRPALRREHQQPQARGHAMRMEFERRGADLRQILRPERHPGEREQGQQEPVRVTIGHDGSPKLASPPSSSPRRAQAQAAARPPPRAPFAFASRRARACAGQLPFIAGGEGTAGPHPPDAEDSWRFPPIQQRSLPPRSRRESAPRPGPGFAKKYGPLIVGAVLLFLAAVAGLLYWQDRQAKAAAADSETLTRR